MMIMKDNEKTRSLDSSRVEHLTDLVDYQQGSIVSRTIIDRKTGTVTLFAFDEGQGLSEHTTSYDALVYVIDGEAKITISGEMFSLGKGEMIVMPANKPHAISVTKRFKMMLIMIRS